MGRRRWRKIWTLAAGEFDPKGFTNKPILRRPMWQKRYTPKSLTSHVWKLAWGRETFDLVLLKIVPDRISDRRSNHDCFDLIRIAPLEQT